MDFDFTEEQVMLRSLAREILTQRCPTHHVRQMMDDPGGYSEELYQQLAETGLLGVAIEPEHGGQGLGMVELALIQEELGRAVYPGPFFASVVLSASALAASGDPDQIRDHLPGIANGGTKATLAVTEDSLSPGPGGVGLRARPSGAGYVLSGTKRFVPFAHAANLILVAARTHEGSDPSRGITLFALERGTPGLSLEPDRGIDLTSKTSTLTLDNTRVGGEAVVGELDAGWKFVEAALRRAAVAAAAEMLGAARKCLELSVEYARLREQFGQPIGSFQAVKHMCAEMLLEVENAHAATYYAAWALDAEAPDADLAASVAKAYVGEAARKVCGTAIQVHGGIGFTWEYDLHLYFKRAKYYEPLYGDADTHRELAVREVLASLPVPVLA